MARLSQDDPRLGTLLADRYRIDALIGEGGMGKVYAAEHVLMKKRLAVKVLHRELTSVPEVVARFEREAMAAANIEHPNVAAATDFGKLSDGSVFLVLEYVQGRNLRDETAEGPLPLERALRITRQIAAGLGSAHAQGIVHRDLKPENVMLVEKGADPDFVKVLDFGIAKVPLGEASLNPARQDQAITKAGMVFGTPEYMAPEQALGQLVDGRADLYALGVMLFEMLAGKRPFSSQSPVGILGQQLANPPPTIAERAAGVVVPPAVEQIVQRLLARDRDQRFSSASELVEVLDVLLAPSPGRGGYRFTIADGSPSQVPPRPLPAMNARGRGANESPLPRFTASGDLGGAPPPFAPSSIPPSGAYPEKKAALQGAPAPGAGLGTRARWLWSSARAALRRVGPRAEGLRSRLPPRLRESLRPVPTRALLVAGGLSTLVISILGVALVVTLVRACSADPETAASSLAVRSAPLPVPSARASNTASPAELALAAKQGPSAFPLLTQKYPTDPEVLVEMARSWAAENDLTMATATAARALSLYPPLRQDQRLKRLLYQAAQARGASEPAFALLQGAMGPDGAELVWDLAADTNVKPALRQRAGQWLRSSAFRRVAPEPLQLAADLRTAKNCETAHALLAKAREIGDLRSVPQLEAWSQTSGCGRAKQADCMPCLRRDNALNDALSAMKSRASGADAR